MNIYTPDQAAELLCPMNREPCVAGRCMVWHWISPPEVKSHLHMAIPKPPAMISNRDAPGIGCCNLPYDMEPAA